MFGEGEINYVNEWKGTHCAICNIAKLSTDIGDISYQEFYEFLEKNTTEIRGPTYLEYLYGVNSLENLYEVDEGSKEKISEGNILSGEKYSIITGRNKEVDFLGLWDREDFVLRSYIVKSDEINEKTECNVFDITKA